MPPAQSVFLRMVVTQALITIETALFHAIPCFASLLQTSSWLHKACEHLRKNALHPTSTPFTAFNLDLSLGLPRNAQDVCAWALFLDCCVESAQHMHIGCILAKHKVSVGITSLL